MRDKLPKSERAKLLGLAEPTLWSSEGKEARQYLTETRGFSKKVLKQFRLGYVPSRIKASDGNRHEFAGRIIIPIFNQYGDLVALSSRDWREDAYMKFFHESFQKSFYLYGLNLASDSIIAKNKVVIVEGEFDVVSLHSKGLRCVVGVLGSSLQLYHFALLSRYCREMFIVFDGDEAGQKARRRAMRTCAKHELFETQKMNIIPVNLPGSSDPDDIVSKEGVEAFVEILRDEKQKMKEMRG